MKIEDFRNTTFVVDLGTMLTFWSMLTSKIIGLLNSLTWKKILFKFQVNRMKIENFRNKTEVVDLWPFLTLWPQKTIGFFLMTYSTMWWSFVKIVLKLWPGGDKQTNRQKNKIDWPIYLQNRRFLKYIGQSILFVCLFVAYRSQFSTDLHETSPHCRVCHEEEAYGVFLFFILGQTVNIGQRSAA